MKAIKLFSTKGFTDRFYLMLEKNISLHLPISRSIVSGMVRAARYTDIVLCRLCG